MSYPFPAGVNYDDLGFDPGGQIVALILSEKIVRMEVRHEDDDYGRSNCSRPITHAQAVQVLKNATSLYPEGFEIKVDEAGPVSILGHYGYCVLEERVLHTVSRKPRHNTPEGRADIINSFETLVTRIALGESELV